MVRWIFRLCGLSAVVQNTFQMNKRFSHFPSLLQELYQTPETETYKKTKVTYYCAVTHRPMLNNFYPCYSWPNYVVDDGILIAMCYETSKAPSCTTTTHEAKCSICPCLAFSLEAEQSVCVKPWTKWIWRLQRASKDVISSLSIKALGLDDTRKNRTKGALQAGSSHSWLYLYVTVILYYYMRLRPCLLSWAKQRQKSFSRIIWLQRFMQILYRFLWIWRYEPLL